MMAGFRVVGAVDRYPPACEIYARNLGLRPICEDLTRIDGDTIVHESGFEPGEIDVVVGCPPCQSFTRLRRGREELEQQSLVLTFVRRVLEIRPRFVVFENVRGILTGGRPWLDKLIKVLQRGGYRCGAPKVLDAADFGVPQRRKRLIVLATRLRRALRYPPRTHGRPPPRLGLRPWVTVREAISDLPALEAGE